MTNFYLVRLEGNKFLAGGKGLDQPSKANTFPELQKALEAALAADGAVGVSEYTEQFSPVRHLSLADAEKTLNPEEGN